MKHVHFIGIGGTGLSAIARLLLESGYEVSGSDRAASPLAKDLAGAGARVVVGHAAENVTGADLVIRSSAVPDDNPEISAALAAGIPVIKRHEFLGQLMAEKPIGVAISGTHGKTTTTAMIAWLLTHLGLDPSFIIGGVSKNLGSNAHAGQGKYFVLEADEYDRTFLGLRPDLIVLTNMEHDHPDCYPTPAEYRQAFAEFIGRLKPTGTLLVCSDDPQLHQLAGETGPKKRSFCYGIQNHADYRALNLKPGTQGGLRFDALYRKENGEAVYLAEVNLSVPGEHNVRNALAALSVAHLLNLPVAKAAQALSEFTGTGRRFDVQGEAGGIVVIDDYAHHPTEIAVNLAAARVRYPERRIWAVWQPHTYSRLQALMPAFLTAFKDADKVLVTEIYAAREKNEGFSAAQIAGQIPGALFAPTLADAAGQLLQQLLPGDILLVFSAGDADWISRSVLAELTRLNGSRREQ